jgi:phosphoglycerol transferase MdoB-like AlkP superfamily enzyme
MGFIRIKQATATLALPWLITVGVQSLGRFYLFLTYGSNEISSSFFTDDIIKLFLTGLRYDMRIASLFYGALLLIISLLAIHPPSFTRSQKSWPYIAAILSMFTLMMTICNVYYYATYERYIDIFVFGIVEEDPEAVLKTLWSDYPVLKGTFALALFGWLTLRLYRFWQKKWISYPFKSHHPSVAIVGSLLIVSLIGVSARGAVGTFPLRQSDTQVSNIPLLNKLTPNGVIALSWAIKDHRRSLTFPPATNSEGEQLLSQFLNKPTKAGLSPFLTKTAPHPLVKNTPPHVVFAVMESLSTHLLTFDQTQRDLLGELRPHWEKDWLFTRFLAEGNGTMDSLSRFFIRSPVSIISQSMAQFNTFKSNMFTPFLKNGYKVIFITSGNGAWRNLNQFLPHLGVSEFIEKNTLQRLYPEATEGTWGVPDEYMFRYAEQRLAQADKKGEPIFIMMMSTTFHPPYKAPGHYQQLNFTWTKEEQSRLSHLAKDQEALAEIIRTFRYANDQLGRFISKIKAQPLGKRTILAVTGDHNVRGIGYSAPSELVLKYAVPFYLSVPQRYQVNTYFNANRVGSHKDIMPTLYQLSLSDTPYYRMGCNLLAKKREIEWCMGYNPQVLISPEGAFPLSENGTFYPWASSTTLLLANPKPMDAKQQKTFFRWQAFTDLLAWQLNRQIHQQN